MDRGELFNHEFEVWPTKEGGFLITIGANFAMGEQRPGRDSLAFVRDRYAFTNVEDLMRWMRDHAQGFSAPKAYCDRTATEAVAAEKFVDGLKKADWKTPG